MQTISRTEAASALSATFVPGVGVVVLIPVPRVKPTDEEQEAERNEPATGTPIGLAHTEPWPQEGHPWTGAEGYDS